MVTTVEIGGWVEEILEHLVRAGYYASKAEAVRDAIRRLIESMDLRIIALRAYRDGRISYQLATEISNTSYEELLAYFLKRGVVPELGSDELEEVEEGARLILEAPGVVVDLSTLYTLYHIGLLAQLPRLGIDIYVPKSGSYEVRLAEMRMAVFHKKATRIRGILQMDPAPGAVEYARRNGVTVVEAEAIIHAAHRGLVVVSDDARTRLNARLSGALAAPTLSLIVYGMRGGAIRPMEYDRILEKMRAIPILVPEGAEKLGTLR